MEIIIQSLPRLLSGSLVTIQITALSVFIGFFMAIPLSILRVSSNKMLSLPVYAFTFYFRGTPLLVQIFLIYYGSGQFQVFLRLRSDSGACSRAHGSVRFYP
jgi:arginine/ornithine transport system permease protein